MSTATLAADDALGILETHGFTPAMVALDAMEKAAGIRVLQAEVNDMLGTCLKLAGPVANLRAALEAGRAAAEAMNGRPVSDLIPRPDPKALAAILSPKEISPLIQQPVVLFPNYEAASLSREDSTMADAPFALGFIETQGFTAVFEAIDTACKAANVEVLGKEKLGGGYVTVIVKGDVAAVKAAIEAGKSRVEGLGKFIAAHVIPRPSASVMSLLPKA